MSIFFSRLLANCPKRVNNERGSDEDLFGIVKDMPMPLNAERFKKEEMGNLIVEGKKFSDLVGETVYLSLIGRNYELKMAYDMMNPQEQKATLVLFFRIKANKNEKSNMISRAATQMRNVAKGLAVGETEARIDAETVRMMKRTAEEVGLDEAQDAQKAQDAKDRRLLRAKRSRCSPYDPFEPTSLAICHSNHSWLCACCCDN